MARETRTLVIGGGATGVGVARDLAMRGVDVTLVESGGLSSGTSGRSHGVLHSGARYAESDPLGAEECLEENRVLRSIAGECVRDTGGLFVQLAEDDPGYFDRKREACKSVGIDIDVLDGDAVRESIPDLSIDVERAMSVPDAVVYPSRLVAANAADVEMRGGTIHLHTPLEELTVRNGRIVAARLGGNGPDRIEPEYVVNATGAWAGIVASMAGVDLEMAPTRGAMVAVRYDGLQPVLNRCREPDDGDIIVPHANEVVLGTTSVPTPDPDDYERADWEVETCIEECAAMLPPVANAEIDRAWWGIRPLYAPSEDETDRRGISRGFVRIDHATDDVDNLVSIVGGKLTTYRRMAESTADLVCERLGIDRACETADRELPGVDAPETLDRCVTRYDGRGQADTDVLDGSNAR